MEDESKKTLDATAQADGQALDAIQEALDKAMGEGNPAQKPGGQGGQPGTGDGKGEGNPAPAEAKPEDKKGDNAEPPKQEEPPKNAEPPKNEEPSKNEEEPKGEPPKNEEPPKQKEPPAKKDDPLSKLDGLVKTYDEEGGFDDNDWKDFFAVQNAMRDELVKLRTEIASFKDLQSEYGQYIADRNMEDLNARVDTAFGKMEDYEGLVGKGGIAGLGKEFSDARTAILEKAGVLMDGYRAQQKEKSLEDVIFEATQLHAVQNGWQAPDKSDRRSRFTSVPSSPQEKPSARTADEADAAALGTIDEFLKRSDK